MSQEKRKQTKKMKQREKVEKSIKRLENAQKLASRFALDILLACKADIELMGEVVERLYEITNESLYR